DFRATNRSPKRTLGIRTDRSFVSTPLADNGLCHWRSKAIPKAPAARFLAGRAAESFCWVHRTQPSEKRVRTIGRLGRQVLSLRGEPGYSEIGRRLARFSWEIV